MSKPVTFLKYWQNIYLTTHKWMTILSIFFSSRNKSLLSVLNASDSQEKPLTGSELNLTVGRLERCSSDIPGKGGQGLLFIFSTGKMKLIFCFLSTQIFFFFNDLHPIWEGGFWICCSLVHWRIFNLWQSWKRSWKSEIFFICGIRNLVGDGGSHS